MSAPFPPFLHSTQSNNSADSSSLRTSIRGAIEGLPTFFGILFLALTFRAPFIAGVDSNKLPATTFDTSAYATARTTSALSRRPLIPLFPIALVGVTRLFLALFLPHGGPLTRLLHQVGGRYLIFHLLRSTSGFVARFEGRRNASLLAIRQDDSLFPRLFALISTVLLAVFLYGVAERFIFTRSADIEFPLLLVLLHLGGLLAVRLHTVRDLFLALEIVTLATYVLLAAERHNRFATYSGVQALLLGSVPSALFLVGCSFLYLHTGSLALADIDLLLGGVSGFGSAFSGSISSAFPVLFASNFDLGTTFSDGVTSWWNSDSNINSNHFPFESILASTQPVTALTVRGLLLVLFNLLFKITAAPFHFWAPSVYGKGPLASVTLLSLYSKAIGLFLIFKLLWVVFSAFTAVTTPLFLAIGVLSVLVGIFGAFTETVIKRFRVYSSRGHVGFRLVGVSLATLDGASAGFHYLSVYLVSSLLAWFILITRGRQSHHISSFASLRTTDPLFAIVFALLILSISGIPPLGGFFVKLDTFAALLEAGHSFPAYFLFLRTVASFFYYLRVVKVLFFDNGSVEGRTVIVSRSVTRYDGRTWLRRVLFLILVAYIGLVQPPLLSLQAEIISSLL